MYLEAIKKYVKYAKAMNNLPDVFCLGILRPSEVQMEHGHFVKAAEEFKKEIIRKDFTDVNYIDYFMCDIDGKRVKVFALFRKEIEE